MDWKVRLQEGNSDFLPLPRINLIMRCEMGGEENGPHRSWRVAGARGGEFCVRTGICLGICCGINCLVITPGDLLHRQFIKAAS